MKLLTLNTHSLLEENYKRKLSEFITAIARELPDVIALQEVNQKKKAASLSAGRLRGYFPCYAQAVIREGNHALSVAEGLYAQGISYHWTWLPIKNGYGKYDEGVAVMSRAPIEATDAITVSRTEDYSDWKTRKLLGIQVGGTWFYSVHLGWWDDPEEIGRAHV